MQDVAREILDLRAQLEELRASQLPMKAGYIDLDSPAASGYYKLGFRPLALWLWANNTAGATLTLSVGFATYDEENVNGSQLSQGASSIRRSGAGEWRANSGIFAAGVLSNDDGSLDGTLQIESFDPDGFSYTSSGAIPLVRGFAIGR